jgi:hypothetical protein
MEKGGPVAPWFSNEFQMVPVAQNMLLKQSIVEECLPIFEFG